MDVYSDLDANTLIDDTYVSEDIWQKFEMDDMQLQQLPVFDDVCSMLLSSQVKYDCMWNAYCKGGEHGNRSCNSKSLSPIPPGDLKPPVMQVQTSSQQSLLKPDLKLSVDPNTVVPMMPSYHYSIQTPPISDDEDSKPTQILQSLQSALSENELDDGDLSDYFKEIEKNGCIFDEDLEEEDDDMDIKREIDLREQHENEMRAYYAATDHSYHKGPHAAMHSGNLGIDTPSDSEEEIDVVSLSDKFSMSKASAGALPTNPSIKDRRQIQRTMQSRFPQGVKTIMPIKKQQTPTKKAPESNKYKRGKQNQRQYKRKYRFLQSSDSEQEPLEKRHLHNNMERQRRIDLRNLFNDLKRLIPEFVKKPRAAKVTILRSAAQYCEDLTKGEIIYNREVEKLRQKQIYLRSKLSKLRREVAAIR